MSPMSPLVASLWITLIGMGLISIAVLLLWGLMEAMMRFTARFATEEAEAGAAENAETEHPEVLPAVPASDQKKRAAAVAVAVAMALRRPSARANLSQTSGSGWQAITRANQLNRPTHITRKSRGSVR